jgi:hypothetical protein
MKQNVSLVVMSLLTLLLTTFHGAHDMILGYAPPGWGNLIFILLMVVWLYATLALAERRWPYIVVLVFTLLASLLPVIHMSGTKGLVGRSAPGSAGAFFFAWTLLVVGLTGICSVALSVRGLWSLRRARTAR